MYAYNSKERYRDCRKPRHYDAAQSQINPKNGPMRAQANGLNYAAKRTWMPRLDKTVPFYGAWTVGQRQSY